ncbi:uncharacterized protein FOMMEDRAFT_152933 [Fomitiporia mediterranea MF3/22]|uniref:uncharacterized protein n=1 Tax=Fomitiporia mediterranea (strain MF3/22) TaxID=694068 RepID=UPI0004408369|nr:uncharacterized protein FOMMEDRAFT_152933 [Fomitiporia mediterranea MF3/22]EJD05605.1 hypothetical protein FOMMEDRAFT_152933 [Fomitiporia mediterranea MF3/22]
MSTTRRIVACANCRSARRKCTGPAVDMSCGTCLERDVPCKGSVPTGQKKRNTNEYQTKYEDKAIQVPDPPTTNDPIHSKDKYSNAIPAYDEQDLSLTNGPILNQHKVSGEFHYNSHSDKGRAVLQGSVAERTGAFESWPAQHDHPFIAHNLPRYQATQEDYRGDFVQGSSTGTFTTNFEVSPMFNFLGNDYTRQQ